MPLATHTQKLPPGKTWPGDLDVDYIRCLRFPAFEAMRARVAAHTGWRWHEIDAGHDAMITHPDAIATFLMESRTEGSSPAG